MTSGERIGQLHHVARPGEPGKDPRPMDDLQTGPPVLTGRTPSNTTRANGERRPQLPALKDEGPRYRQVRLVQPGWDNNMAPLQSENSITMRVHTRYISRNRRSRADPAAAKRPQDAVSGPSKSERRAQLQRRMSKPIAELLGNQPIQELRNLEIRPG